ncbi:hypothetical protein FACS1894184_19100 [Clostridia bacterium]|nr:hypothetical protein FACS1894184_19100 [Clostridia bacterium]
MCVNHLPPAVVAAGNPCRTICSIDDYRKKENERYSEAIIFDKSWTHANGVKNVMKKEMAFKLNEKTGYIKYD